MINDIVRKYDSREINKLKPIIQKWFDETVKRILDDPTKYQDRIDMLKDNIKYNRGYVEFFGYFIYLCNINKNNPIFEDTKVYLSRGQFVFPYWIEKHLVFEKKINDKSHTLNGCKLSLYYNDNDDTISILLSYKPVEKCCNIV